MIPSTIGNRHFEEKMVLEKKRDKITSNGRIFRIKSCGYEINFDIDIETQQGVDCVIMAEIF